jgi:hypothetical protein
VTKGLSEYDFIPIDSLRGLSNQDRKNWYLETRSLGLWSLSKIEKTLDLHFTRFPSLKEKDQAIVDRAYESLQKTTADWDEETMNAIKNMYGEGQTPGFLSSSRQPKVLMLFESDCSAVYGGEKHSLPDKKWTAVLLIAREHINGNPSVGKEAIYIACNVDTTRSVPAWFRQAGGNAKRFVDDGLLEADSEGRVRITIDHELIRIVPVRDVLGDSSEGQD